MVHVLKLQVQTNVTLPTTMPLGIVIGAVHISSNTSSTRIATKVTIHCYFLILIQSMTLPSTMFLLKDIVMCALPIILILQNIKLTNTSHK